MNIRELFDKIRGVKNMELVVPSDLEVIPMREILSDDKIALLDEIKKHYEEILLKKENFLINDLSSKYFTDEMNMYMSLFNRIVMNHESIYNFDTMPEYKKEDLYVQCLVNPKKINMYIQQMEELYTETHLKLIALNELYDEYVKNVSDKPLAKNKIETIANEIYNLTNNYIVFRGIVFSALKEVETYKKELKVNINIDESEETILEKYKKRIIGYASKLIPDLLDAILEQNLDIVNTICEIEEALEIYSYNNLDVEKLNIELKETDAIKKVSDNREELIKKINDLEVKYSVLSKYGKYELDLRPLYEIKFDILTIDIVNQANSPFAKEKDDEVLSYYMDVLASRIETYITGSDSLASQWLGDDASKFIPMMIKILKNGDAYDYDLILEDELKLSFALSMKSKYWANYFFNNYTLDFTFTSRNKYLRYHIDDNKNKIMFAEMPNFPFRTLCQIWNLFPNSSDDNVYEEFGKIYQYFSFEDETSFHIPEGIEWLFLHSIDEKTINIIKDKINGKFFYTSSTLKTFIVKDKDFFEKTHLNVPKIILNEGLTSFEFPIDLVALQAKSLTIPSTLEKLSYYSIHNYEERLSLPNYSYLDIPELIFTNFESSKIFGNSENRRQIIEVRCEETKRIIRSRAVNHKIAQYIDARFKLVDPNKIILVSTNDQRIELDIASMVKRIFWERLFGSTKNVHHIFKKHEIDYMLDGEINGKTVTNLVLEECNRIIKNAMEGKYEKVENNRRYR